MNRSRQMARLGLLLLGAVLARRLEPATAAAGLCGLALLAGIWWRHVGWSALFGFGGGLLGLALRYSNGDREQLYANLHALTVLTILLVGLYLIGRGAAPHGKHGEND